MRSPRLGCHAALVCVVGVLRAASFDDRVEALFRPPLGDRITLSPDGLRVAYARQDGRELALVILGVENPWGKRTITVAAERDAAGAEGPPPVQLRFLRWATANRLVYAPTERVVPLPPVMDSNGRAIPNPDGPTIHAPVMVTDADGKQRGILVEARNFQETPAEARKTLADLLRTTKELQATRNEPVRWRMPHLDILGFLPRDPEQLIIRTHGAYSIPTQHLVDIRTGSIREFGDEWPAPPGEPYIFDGFRLKVVGERKPAERPTIAWRDDDLARVQRELEMKFPRRIVEILDWSETRSRVLVRVTGGSDPGRIFIFQRPEDLVLEILRCNPWLSAAKLNETRYFECDAPDGTRLSGYLTWPSQPRGSPAPLIVVFPSGFPGWAQTPFDAEAQVFADLGFAVARLNHRSVAGVRPQDLTALRGAVDRVSVNDALAAIERLAARNPERAFDRRRVATFGRGFGGYLAIRALQLEPEAFRGGIAIDAPMELRSWLHAAEAVGATAPTRAAHHIPASLIDFPGTDWKNFSVVDQADTLGNPVLLLVEPGRNPAIDASTKELRARLQTLGRGRDYLEIEPGFAAGLPKPRAATYRKIEEFLNLLLHDDEVKIGPTEEVR